MRTLSPEERAELLRRREIEFGERHPNAPDFCPADGRCWNCKYDFVENDGEHFPTVFISGCRKCHQSFCE